MPDSFDDNTDDMDSSSDSSPENTSPDDSDSVSDDANTPEDSDDSAQTEDENVAEDTKNSSNPDSVKNVPFHKHPRFQELNTLVKELKEKNERLEREHEEERRLQNATPEEKAVYELIHKHGLAPKSDIEGLERKLAALKDDQDFQKFLEKHPDAANKKEVLKTLAYSPTYIRSSYEDIYTNVFGGNSPDAPGRKVVGRRLKSGMKPISSGGGNSDDGGHMYTRSEIQKMSEKEYEKNRKEIQKQMKEGLIK